MYSTVPLLVIATVPWLAAPRLVMVSVLPSTSVSLPRTLIVVPVSSAVVTESGFATGGSLTPVTLTVTVEDAVPPLPSVIV